MLLVVSRVAAQSESQTEDDPEHEQEDSKKSADDEDEDEDVAWIPHPDVSVSHYFPDAPNRSMIATYSLSRLSDWFLS